MKNEPDIELPEIEEKEEGFPWLIIVSIVVVAVIVGAWLMRKNAQQNSSFAALEQQRVEQKLVLDQERDKVFELTKQLDILKGQIAAQKAGDHKEAVVRYNGMAEEQRAQREKVKKLADEYNQLIEKIHALQ